MPTSNGSLAMTDGGANISASISDKFRVGAQVYVRNVGDLGNFHPQLDWAYGDYKFKDWFGIRAGKVKTALGLLNDTQDAEFLYTWAILPQSVYPLDLRSNTIAHTGGDVYGTVGLRKAGSLSYTGYFGTRVNDAYGGMYYSGADNGYLMKSYGGKAGGADLRWNTPIAGLMLGGSWADQTLNMTVTIIAAGNAIATLFAQPQHITAVYGDYAHGRWHFNGEFRKNRQLLNTSLFGVTSVGNASDRGMFLTASFRVTNRLEVGAYNSRYYIDKPIDQRPAASHIFDQTITARYDITKWWNVKVEGHFINGFGDSFSAHGFYLRDNSNLKPVTNMLIIRTGYNM